MLHGTVMDLTYPAHRFANLHIGLVVTDCAVPAGASQESLAAAENWLGVVLPWEVGSSWCATRLVSCAHHLWPQQATETLKV